MTLHNRGLNAQVLLALPPPASRAHPIKATSPRFPPSRMDAPPAHKSPKPREKPPHDPGPAAPRRQSPKAEARPLPWRKGASPDASPCMPGTGGRPVQSGGQPSRLSRSPITRAPQLPQHTYSVRLGQQRRPQPCCQLGREGGRMKLSPPSPFSQGLR